MKSTSNVVRQTWSLDDRLACRKPTLLPRVSMLDHVSLLYFAFVILRIMKLSPNYVNH